MEYETLKIDEQSAIQKIQIYRPDANNSINTTLLQELRLAFIAAAEDENIKIIVLEGLPDIFCTGMDFQEILQQKTEAVNLKISHHNYYEILKQMSESSQIIVSVVRGKVQGGGVGLVAASDLVIADETATFVLSELLFGLLPACVLPFLIRRVGFQKAYRLALTTQSISVEDACNWGLVDEYSLDTNKILHQYLRRLKCLPASGVKELKKYINQLWIIQQETEDLAVNTISQLVEDPNIQEKIRLYVEEGIFPWQT